MTTDNLPATQKGQAVAQRSEAASLMEAIVKLTSSPQFNPEGMERMVALYERIKDREAQAAFNVAMSASQEEMRPIAKDCEGEKSRYASYYAMDSALRPIYTKHGLALSFNTAPADRDTDIFVICYVTHSGYSREYRLLMPADGKGPRGGEVMSRTHATGSAVTYGMRYLLKMIFNVAIGSDGTDDDGRAAGRKTPRPPRPTESQFITAAQVAELRAMLDNSPEREKRFCDRHLDGAPLEDISPLALGDCVNLILAANSKRAHAAPQRPAGAFQPDRVPSMPPKPQSSPASNAAPKRYPDSVEGDFQRELDHDPETGEVTEPDRPTTRPRPPQPPRPAQNAGLHSAGPTSEAFPPASSVPVASATGPSHPATSADHDNGMPWQLRVVRILERAPDFACANIVDLLHHQSRLFNVAENMEEAEQIFAHHIRDHYRKVPHPANVDTLKKAWDQQMERLR